MEEQQGEQGTTELQEIQVAVIAVHPGEEEEVEEEELGEEMKRGEMEMKKKMKRITTETREEGRSHRRIL